MSSSIGFGVSRESDHLVSFLVSVLRKFLVPEALTESLNPENARNDSEDETVLPNSSMPKVEKPKKGSKRGRSKAERQAAIKEKRAKALNFSDSTASEVNLTLISAIIVSSFSEWISNY